MTEGEKFIASHGLSAADFTRIAANGFGDPQNSYAYSIAYFRDQVYIGTLRNALPLLKLFPPLDASAHGALASQDSGASRGSRSAGPNLALESL